MLTAETNPQKDHTWMFVVAEILKNLSWICWQQRGIKECSLAKTVNKWINVWCAEPVQIYVPGQVLALEERAFLAQSFSFFFSIFHPQRRRSAPCPGLVEFFSVSGNVGDLTFPVIHQTLPDQHIPAPSQHLDSWEFSQTTPFVLRWAPASARPGRDRATRAGRDSSWGEEERSDGGGFGKCSKYLHWRMTGMFIKEWEVHLQVFLSPEAASPLETPGSSPLPPLEHSDLLKLYKFTQKGLLLKSTWKEQQWNL